MAEKKIGRNPGRYMYKDIPVKVSVPIHKSCCRKNNGDESYRNII